MDMDERRGSGARGTDTGKKERAGYTESHLAQESVLNTVNIIHIITVEVISRWKGHIKGACRLCYSQNYCLNCFRRKVILQIGEFCSSGRKDILWHITRVLYILHRHMAEYFT